MQVFDRSGTGFISAADLRAAMLALGESLTEEEADRMIKDADSNGDGFIDYKGNIELL